MASTDETQTPADSVKQSEMPSTPGTVKESVVSGVQIQSIVDPEPVEERVVPGVQVKSIVEPEREVRGWLFWITICLVVPTICSITFTGSVTFLVFATPIGLFLSPILVPVGVILFFGAAGVLSGAGSGLAALSAVVWVYKYCRGEEPVYFDRIAAAKNHIAGYISHQGVRRASDISVKLADGSASAVSVTLADGTKMMITSVPWKPDFSRRGSPISD